MEIKNDWVRIILTLVVGIIVALLLIKVLIWFAEDAFATKPVPYKTICHNTPGNQVTIDFVNEEGYTGHLGTPHSVSTFDTDGACVEVSPSPSLSPIPTAGISATLTPTPTDIQECEEKCEETPTPTDTPEPTTVPQNNTGGGGDGRSDGLSSCPDCTKGPPYSPYDGAVVGWK